MLKPWQVRSYAANEQLQIGVEEETLKMNTIWDSSWLRVWGAEGKRGLGSRWLLALSVLFSAAALPALASHAGTAAGEAGVLARVFLLDATTLAETRRRVQAGDAALAPALAALRRDAERALEAGPFSVVAKDFLPPSGDKHDYMSVGPFWWPDPDRPDGLPYIRRDGRVNPERDQYDSRPMSDMNSAVGTLSLAYYFTGHEPYAEHAAHLIRTWFLAEATRMNPHLQYGQAIPGRTEGRGIGIIDTAQLAHTLMDSVGLLAGSDAWTAEDQRGLEDWFKDYLGWLLESQHGRDEARTRNNHGTWYDVQVAAFALFVGEEALARAVLEHSAARRIAAHIQPDGRQPQELSRTRSYSYSTMNLRGMFELATLGERVEVDLWHFETDDGRGIRRALEWLIPYALGDQEWEHEQLGGIAPTSLVPLLRRAARVYHEPRYEQALRRIPGVESEDRLHLLWPPRAGGE